MTREETMPLPGEAESCWVAGAPPPRYPRDEQSDRAHLALHGRGSVGPS